jgi:phosphoglycerol transferase MdoB-like AlkP superfamily enzyme
LLAVNQKINNQLKTKTMKKIIIGSVVATVIFFAFQTVMWMGGFHNDFNTYTDKQPAIMQVLNDNLDKDGMYMMPTGDWSQPDAAAQEEKIMTENMGKPWAMVFYHKQMAGMEMSAMLLGLLYTFISCLIAALILFYGKFNSFQSRFLVAFGLALFTLMQGVLDDMNWWGYPWSFVKPEVIDLTLGWGICALWLAWYVKNTES